MSYLYTWSCISEKYPKLNMYLEELLKARKSFNLSGARKREEFIKLIEESLAPLLVIDDWKNKNVIDVGSGAGFPGIPLAIAQEDANFLLVDISVKKTAFLNLVKTKLQLKNVEILCTDAYALKGESRFIEAFDIALSRGVGETDYLRSIIFPLLKIGGRMLLFKSEGVGHKIKPGLVLLEEKKYE
ncbi:MAG: 16S rRNA (guanine(527)-N(7))-methyltransferase RsmG [bacterium]|nr:16S rRNA (guanine(527)-N(7))-methyltransferase RsmG [bacterium]